MNGEKRYTCMRSCFLSLNKLILPDLAFFQLQVNNPEFWEGKKIHYWFLVGDRCAWYKIQKVWRIHSENVSPSSYCPAAPACIQAKAVLSLLRDACVCVCVCVCVCAWLHMSLCSLSTIKFGKRFTSVRVKDPCPYSPHGWTLTLLIAIQVVFHIFM